MKYTHSMSGMGKLLVDGLDVGAVYYELDRDRTEIDKPTGGKLSGEPHALFQAYKEGGAALISSDGRKVPIVVTHIMKDEHVAVVQLERRFVH